MQVGRRYAIAESIVNMIIKREIRLIAIADDDYTFVPEELSFDD